MSNKETIISWNDFQTYADIIVEAIKKSGKKYDAIIGVARGGLFLAGYLSYHLEIKEVDVVNVQTYDNRKRVDPRIIDFPKELVGENLLLVDDILDSGTTFGLLAQWLEPIDISYDKVALVDKGRSDVDLEYLGITVDKDAWVVYPWEISPKIDKLSTAY